MGAIVDALAAGCTAAFLVVVTVVGLGALCAARQHRSRPAPPVPVLQTIHRRPQGPQFPGAGTERDCGGVWVWR